jgi:hypothetical protein
MRYPVLKSCHTRDLLCVRPILGGYEMLMRFILLLAVATRKKIHCYRNQRAQRIYRIVSIMVFPFAIMIEYVTYHVLGTGRIGAKNLAFRLLNGACRGLCQPRHYKLSQYVHEGNVLSDSL